MKGKEFKPIVRMLRRHQTATERRLWHALRARACLGYKFRRQQPIGPYIVDFCCLERKLIIELDGGQHAFQECADRLRSEYLEREGFTVIRFWDREVFANLSGVLERILTHLEPPSPQPSPLKGEGEPSSQAFNIPS